MVEKFISKNGNFNKLIESINDFQKVSVFGTTLNEQVFLMSNSNSKICYVTSSFKKATLVKENLEKQGYVCEVINEIFSYTFAELKESVYHGNLQKIKNFNSGKVQVLIVLSDALLNKYGDDVLKNEGILFEVGKTFEFTNLSKTLTSFGYKKQLAVESSGEFSIRGDVLDIFPFGSDGPFRMSFYGDEVEFIKQIDEITQLSVKDDVESVLVSKKLKIDLTQSDKETLKLDLEKEINKTKNQVNEMQDSNKIDELLEKQENLESIYNYIFNYNNFENNFCHVYGQMQWLNLFDLLDEQTLIVFDEPKQIIDAVNFKIMQLEDEFKQDVLQGLALNSHKSFYLNLQQIFSFSKNNGLLSFGSIVTSNRIFAPQKVFNINCGTILNYFTNMSVFVQDVKQFTKEGFTQIVFVKEMSLAENLQKRLLQLGISVNICSTLNQAQFKTVNLVLKQTNISVCLMEEKLFVVGYDKLIKPKELVKIANVEENSEEFLQSLIPSVGDFVVHETHGIGKCIEIKEIAVGGIKKDYVVLEYKNNDKLFLPVENINTVSKYVGSEKTPTLNKLGGVEFYKTKQKVKSQLKENAVELVKLYAQREEKEGIVFPKDDELQQAFENEFVYTETPDQLKAIEEVKQDMQSSKIMDRLICGDVGYGKTEVALRAIFKAVSAGCQVAFLCPTTILSQQHYNTCVSRMQEFGVTVEVLNRFKTPKEQREIVSKVNAGEINVICGTHRLLSKDIKFKNLGLLVLDEEQKFGVVDKEKIKTLKENIDVLTLSATPIPRSMHMSLVGIRDISVINTPPPLKMPVISQVVPYSEHLIKKVIEQEIERNGQVLIIYNNVFSIYNFYSVVKNLVNENVNVSVAHGQMAEHELETEIFKLYNQTTQVLISTTLIENGIDLPTANSIIIVNSSDLGLSQLYQLKGRVGRGTVQAYAYFTFDQHRLLSENALKRLEAISEFTQLGDGYKISMRDLEIRGAGNVLGVKQSGHMQKVGYAMYVALLKEAVSELKGEMVLKVYDFKIETEFSANLPEFYVSGNVARIKTYNLITKIENLQQLSSVTTKLSNSFGSLPQEVSNLCFVALFKNHLKNLPLKKVSLKQKEIKLEFLSNEDIKTINLPQILQNLKQHLVLNSNNLPIITITNFVGLCEGFDKTTKFTQLALKDK